MSKFELKPISEEQVTLNNIELSQLWLINYQGELHGPFEENQLKEYQADNSEMFSDITACNIQEEEWKPFYQFKVFQRRRPKISVASEVEPIEKDVYYQLDGNKRGPVPAKFVKELLKAKELKTTDLVSIDNGETWMKIFEHPEFDQRITTQHALPFRPNEDSFMSSSLELIQGNTYKNADEDIMVGLAYLGHKKSKGIQQDFSETSYSYYKPQRNFKWPNIKINPKLAMGIAACFALIMVTTYFTNQSTPDFNSRTIASVSKSKDVVKKVAKSRPVVKKAKRRVYKPKKRNVVKSSPFKKIKRRRYKPKHKPAKKIVRTHNRDPREDYDRNPANDYADPRDRNGDNYYDNYPNDELSAQDAVDEVINDYDADIQADNNNFDHYNDF